MLACRSAKKAWAKLPTSAVEAQVKASDVPSSAQPEKKPTRCPKAMPLKAYTEPLCAKELLNRIKEKLANPTAMVASRKASGTALPVIPAANEPLSAIAAVGAIMPIESAMAPMKESSRRSELFCFCILYLLVTNNPGENHSGIIAVGWMK